MQGRKAVAVKELMIDVFEYPHIPYWFTIKQVIGVIRKSLIETEKCVHPRVVLVFDEQYNLIGLVTLKEILQGLEPKLKSAAMDNAEVAPINDASLLAFETGMFSEGAKTLLDKPVSDVMTPIKIFLSPHDSVVKAVLLMLHHNLMVLPVLENYQKFVGVMIRFEGSPVASKLMLEFGAAIDSIAFGLPGSKLEGLLSVSHTDGAIPGAGTDLMMVDLATLQRVAVARGGRRGDQIETSADGRIFISQSHQVVVLIPVRAPHVSRTNPPADAIVALPLASLMVTFDGEMLAGDATDPRSVLNATNYRLEGVTTGIVPILGVAYDQVNRTAVLSVSPLVADRYQLRVLPSIHGVGGLALASEYSTEFSALSDLSAVLGLEFSRARSDRLTGTISYDVTVTNLGEHRLVLPVILQLTAGQHFDGEPLGTDGRAADGSWLIDLSDRLPPSGILLPGHSTTGRTVTFRTPGRQPVHLDASVSGMMTGNNPPTIVSVPSPLATVGEIYRYQAVADDLDGDRLSYVLLRAPAGMAVNSATGALTWTPQVASTSPSTVVLQVYDSFGARDTQSFTLQVNAVNLPPSIIGLAAEVRGSEGNRFVTPAGDLPSRRWLRLW